MHRRARHLNPGSAGAVLALDSRFITGLSNGDPVSTWNDRSGNGNNATETLTNRPTYQTNVQGGSPVVRFDAINDGMSTTCNLSNPFTIVVIHRTISGTSNRVINSLDGNRLIAFNRASNGVFNNATVVNATTPTPGTTVGIGTLTVSATSAFYLDSIDITTGTTATANWGRVSFGTRGTNVAVASADISQTLGFPFALSASLRRRLEHAAAFAFKIPCS